MFIAHQNNFTQEYIDALYAMLEDENNPAYGEVLTIMENHDSLNTSLGAMALMATS